MTIVIESAYNLPTPTHARVMHQGLALPFDVDASESTPADSAVYALNNVRNGLTSDRYKPSFNAWALEMELLGGSQEVSCICIGSSDMFSSSQEITLQFYDGAEFVTIADVVPVDDSPVMFLFSIKSTGRFRIVGDGGARPSIYNIMIGTPLVMQRPMYGGFSPARMNRQTEVVGNMSRTGELLGRSKKRTTLAASYDWQNLDYPWVRANLEGPMGLIQSVETKQAYVAWRPALTGDVDYCMRCSTSAPQAKGQVDLWTFSMTAEVHSYE